MNGTSGNFVFSWKIDFEMYLLRKRLENKPGVENAAVPREHVIFNNLITY